MSANHDDEQHDDEANTPDLPAADLFAPLVAGARALHVALDEAQLLQFRRFCALLADWNTRMNLTAIVEPSQVATRHFLDALTCSLSLAPDERVRPLRVLDVGSGAGLPGLALAIAFPQWQVVSLEATGKKCRFQEAAIAEAQIANAQVICGRAEEFAHDPAHRATYDVVTARALAALPTLLEYCAPFARVGGHIIAPKKGDLASEQAQGARAAALLGAELLAPIPVAIPPLDDGRVLLVARQRYLCASRYPRPAGAPAKKPLGA